MTEPIRQHIENMDMEQRCDKPQVNSSTLVLVLGEGKVQLGSGSNILQLLSVLMRTIGLLADGSLMIRCCPSLQILSVEVNVKERAL